MKKKIASALSNMRKTETKNCAMCGREFTALAQASYCHASCRSRARYMRNTGKPNAPTKIGTRKIGRTNLSHRQKHVHWGQLPEYETAWPKDPDAPTRRQFAAGLRALKAWQVENVRVGLSLNSGDESASKKPGYWHNWQSELARRELYRREGRKPPAKYKKHKRK